MLKYSKSISYKIRKIKSLIINDMNMQTKLITPADIVWHSVVVCTKFVTDS